MNTKIIVLLPIILTVATNTLNATVVTTADQIKKLQTQKSIVEQQIKSLETEAAQEEAPQEEAPQEEAPQEPE